MVAISLYSFEIFNNSIDLPIVKRCVGGHDGRIPFNNLGGRFENRLPEVVFVGSDGAPVTERNRSPEDSLEGGSLEPAAIGGVAGKTALAFNQLLAQFGRC